MVLTDCLSQQYTERVLYIIKSKKTIEAIELRDSIYFLQLKFAQYFRDLLSFELSSWMFRWHIWVV